MAFVKQLVGTTCLLLDVVPLPVNTSLKVLINRAQCLGLKSNSSTQPDWVFEVLPLGLTFDLESVPAGEVMTGTMVIIRQDIRNNKENSDSSKSASLKGVNNLIKVSKNHHSFF